MLSLVVAQMRKPSKVERLTLRIEGAKTRLKLVSSEIIDDNKNSKVFSDKDERDIAKRLKQFGKEIENSDGLAFDGEPMSDEAKESLLESMELLFRQTQRINKKFTPKKYRDDE